MVGFTHRCESDMINLGVYKNESTQECQKHFHVVSPATCWLPYDKQNPLVNKHHKMAERGILNIALSLAIFSAKQLDAGMQNAMAVCLQAPALLDEYPVHEGPLKLAIHNSAVKAYFRSRLLLCGATSLIAFTKFTLFVTT